MAEFSDFETIEDAPKRGLLVLNIFPMSDAETRRFRSDNMQERIETLLLMGADVPHVVDVPLYTVEGVSPREWDLDSINAWVEWDLYPYIQKHNIAYRAVFLVNFGEASAGRHLADTLMRQNLMVLFLP